MTEAAPLEWQIFTFLPSLSLCFLLPMDARFSESWGGGCEVKILSEATKRTKVNKRGLMCHLHVDDSPIPTWVSSLRSRLSVYLFTPLGGLTGISHLTWPDRAIGFPVPNTFPHASLPHLSNGTTISLIVLGAQWIPFFHSVPTSWSLINPLALLQNRPQS